MDENLEGVAKKGLKGLVLLAELSQHVVVIGQIGAQYTKCYFDKGEYRETPETGIQWVMRCFARPKNFYKMF